MTDLNSYFNLGLESTNQPIDNAGMINIFRTPVDTSSENLNRITFKFPKTGLLTGDTMITLQFTLNDGGSAMTSNLTPNLANGAIGAIKRTRILVDNKALVDLQRPGIAENVKLYTRNTQVELAEKEYAMLGNQFRTTVQASGEEAINVDDMRYFNGDANVVGFNRNVIKQVATSKVYGIKLKHLGADFLEANSLPVFLMGHREIVLELEFHDDCREYIVDPNGGAFNAGDVKVSLADAELVSTHIMLPPDVEAQEVANMARQAVQYPLLDTYVVKGVVDTAGIGLGSVQDQTYRINFQNREVHNLLICNIDTVASAKRTIANQRANSLGGEKLQMKVNGQNLFDKRVEDQTLLYQLTTYSEDGRTLKVPFNAWRCDSASLANYRQATNPLYLDYRGGFHYLKVDFSNGNAGVFGSGTLMKTACEIDYSLVPATQTSPKQDEKRDVFFYVTISKLLSIGANQINISY
tara:strand:- start:2644 stop:4044 length:1401 start_codon:yes stop_codon:yes gene_type:complete